MNYGYPAKWLIKYEWPVFVACTSLCADVGSKASVHLIKHPCHRSPGNGTKLLWNLWAIHNNICHYGEASHQHECLCLYIFYLQSAVCDTEHYLSACCVIYAVKPLPPFCHLLQMLLFALLGRFYTLTLCLFLVFISLNTSSCTWVACKRENIMSEYRVH